MANPNYLDPNLFATAELTDRQRIMPIMVIDPSTNEPVGGSLTPQLEQLIDLSRFTPIVFIDPNTTDAIK
jgi:hypothetical protein